MCGIGLRIKRVKYFVILFVFLLFIAQFSNSFAMSCIKQKPYIQQNAKWTIIVYFCSDNDLEDDAIDALNHMELVGSDAQLNIVAQIDDYNCWGGETRRYCVTYDNDLTTINSILADNDTSEKDMDEGQTFIDFVCWTTDNYPAEYYCVIVYDHGTGWHGVCYDDSDGNVSDCITIDELEVCLSNISNHIGKSLDILCFNACEMGTIEVFYQIREYIDIGIASQLPQYNNLPYHLFLGDLKNNISWTPKRFAEEIVNDSFKWEDHAVDEISAHWAEEIPNVVEKVDTLVEELNQSLPSCYFFIRKAIDHSLHDYHHFDLFDFASEIKKWMFFSHSVKTAAQNVMDAIESAVFARQPQKYGDNKYYKGFSIYLEYRPSFYNIKYENTQFAIDTNWDEFLRSYLNITIKSVLCDAFLKVNGNIRNNIEAKICSI